MSTQRLPVVFLGPSLSHGEARQLANVEVLPPAAMGDVCRAACNRPPAIILIDGVFESGPSVWHKEILWALNCGIAVVGASSMGALRAAELQGSGMLGFGVVFEHYASEILTDDDEVAVCHAPAELGWCAISDAMVDIRDAVAILAQRNLISPAQGNAILHHAKSCHFKDRDLRKSLAAVLDSTLSPGVEQWLKQRGPGVKERDCRQLLSRLDSVIAQAQALSVTQKPFTPTVYMDRLIEFGFPAN